MKKYSFFINDYNSTIFFPKERVKTKNQIINILLESCRYILLNPNINKDEAVGEIMIIVDKMSRIFFFQKDKYYSIVFPYKIYKDNDKDKFKLFTKNDIELNSFLISMVISAINEDLFIDECVLDFADFIYEFEKENKYVWNVIKELILLEDGYIRFDNDQEGYEKAVKLGKPLMHPKNHYDLFYTNPVTFKIGLNKYHSTTEMINFVNLTTDCLFVNYYK